MQLNVWDCVILRVNLVDTHAIRKIPNNIILQVFQQNECVFWQILAYICHWVNFGLTSNPVNDVIARVAANEFLICTMSDDPLYLYQNLQKYLRFQSY